MRFSLKIKVLILTFVVCGTSYAQEMGNCELEVDKKVVKKFNKLKKKYFKSRDEIVFELKAMVEENPSYAAPAFFLGDHYKKLTFEERKPYVKEKYIDQALHYYKLSSKRCEGFSGHLAYYHMGIFYHKYKKDLKTAAHYFQDYLQKEKEHPKKYKKIAENLADEYFTKFRLLKNPVPYEPKKLEGVNTLEDEYLPMLSPDNNHLYLTRKRTSPLDLTQPLKNGNDRNEYFIKSQKKTETKFSHGRLLGAPFNQFGEKISGQKLVGQGGVCITADNKEMYITLTLLVPAKGQGYKNTQLYYTRYVDGRWTPLKGMGRNINDENNLPTWEGQATISSDGKTMVFATARPSSTEFTAGSETYNSMDLFMVKKMTNGQWGRPKSLGDVINTPGNEKTPFLHSDSKTLYFSSNGHPGMGGYDIFFTQINEYGTWSKPVNVGYPINTEGDEHGFMVSLDGKYAYMSSGVSDKDGSKKDGGLEIIHFPLHKKARPEKVMYIKGKLETEDGQVVKNGKITITDEKTGETHEAMVDEKTGEYVAIVAVKDPEKEKLKSETVILELNEEEVEAPFGSQVAKVNGKEEIIPPGAKVVELGKKEVVLKRGEKIRKVNDTPTIIPVDHQVIVEENLQKVVPVEQIEKEKPEAKKDKQTFVISATGDDMALVTEKMEVDPNEIDGVKKIREKKIEVQEEKAGVAIRLNDVNFSTNSFLLNSKSMSVLDELVKYLNDRPTLSIEVRGHTDNVGQEEKNLKLSGERAKEVVDFLIFEGIDKRRLAFKGFGSSSPKVKNDSAKNRAINRRVEFVPLQ